MGCADHDDVANNQRRGIQPDIIAPALAGNVDVLPRVNFHVHDAIRAKSRVGQAGFGVETNKLKTRRDVQDALQGPVGPIAQATPQRTGGIPATLALIKIELPKHLAGSGIHRNRSAACTTRQIKDALHHQWR